MNTGNLCIGLAQVEDCKLPKDFIDLHIGETRERALVRQLIKDDSITANRSVQSWVVKYVDLLRRKVWLDICMRKSEDRLTGTGGAAWAWAGTSRAAPA